MAKKKSDRQPGVRKRRCQICCVELESDEQCRCNDCRGVLAQIAEAHHYHPPIDAREPAAVRRGRRTT